MSTRTSASRYARALLDVVIAERGNPEQVETELAAFADLLTRNPNLQNALTNPAVPVSGKRGIVTQLTAKLGSSPILAKLLQLLADGDRLVLVPDLLAVYRERLMDHRQIVRADVTTAEPLPDAKVSLLKERLAQLTGRTVTMTTKVDPSIIGGVVARVGSTVYDGSVATQLDKIKNSLRSAV
jgi:F-type H+-transporting ATPase subunit delta